MYKRWQALRAARTWSSTYNSARFCSIMADPVTKLTRLSTNVPIAALISTAVMRGKSDALLGFLRRFHQFTDDRFAMSHYRVRCRSQGARERRQRQRKDDVKGGEGRRRPGRSRWGAIQELWRWGESETGDASLGGGGEGEDAEDLSINSVSKSGSERFRKFSRSRDAHGTSIAHAP